MKIQDLLLAVSVDVERGGPFLQANCARMETSNSCSGSGMDAPAKRFLETVGMDDFQQRETWEKLRGFARVRPHGDVLPFRCTYEKDDADGGPLNSINVAFPHIYSSCDRWVSFADICASKFITGKCPEILETMEFKPVGRQTTKVVEVFGDPRYKIDLSEGKDDLFIKVIELRQTVKNDLKMHSKGTPEYEHLNAMQLALKLIANATSYGALVETTVEETKAEVPCMVYHGGAASKRVARKNIPVPDGEYVAGFKVEKPGQYVAPYGGLIPAGGRLLLAIAEVLFRDRGLSHAYADTDAIAPARPEGMTSDEFRKRVLEVAGGDGWFQKLSPYSDGAPLFEVEDVNYRLFNTRSGKVTGKIKGGRGTTELKPEKLYCLVISAKRYVLFNITKPTRQYPKGQTIVRKVSGHGLGALRYIDDYDPKAHKLTAPDHIAAPIVKSELKEAQRLKRALTAGEEARRLEAAFARGEAGISAEDVRAAQRGEPDATIEQVEDARRHVRDYGELVHGGTPRLLCDLWRIVVDCFRDGKQDKIDDIIGKLPQIQVPQYMQVAITSAHMLERLKNIPNRRGFQFLTMFPPPRQMIQGMRALAPNIAGMANYTPPGVPFDEYKALCETTLYASLPEEGYSPELEAEWIRSETGLFRTDNNEFPHGLFDPKFRLRLVTVADKLRGYFHHPEIKSSGDVGQLSRKAVVSLDKHFIGKETSPLDEDSEDLQDGEPLSSSSDLVVRSGVRNFQPVLDVLQNASQDDAPELPKAFLKLERGMHLTFAEVQEIKKYVSVASGGEKAHAGPGVDALDASAPGRGRRGGVALKYKKMQYDAQCYEAMDPFHKMRVRTLSKLKKFGNFTELSERSGISKDDIDYAARRTVYDLIDDKVMDLRSYNFDWAGVEVAIDDLSGRTARRERQKVLKRQAIHHKQNYRDRQARTELLSAPFDVFSSEIFLPMPTDDCESVHDGLGVVSCEFMHPQIEYWSAEARTRRRRAATLVRVTKYRANDALKRGDAARSGPVLDALEQRVRVRGQGGRDDCATIEGMGA